VQGAGSQIAPGIFLWKQVRSMFSSGIFSSLPVTLGIFLVSLLIVIATSTRFTRKLEDLCEALQLSIGLLSLLSALGANIPNYVSSAIAIVSGHIDVGIGIIVGSNIYNIALILGLCALLTPERAGITLDVPEKQDVRVIALYTLAIALLSFLLIACLPGGPFVTNFHLPGPSRVLLPLISLVALGLFGALLIHTLRRSHGSAGTTLHHHASPQRKAPLSILRLVGEIIFTLVIALGGVLVMVQAGQTLTSDLHMPSVLAGLLVLAVATSLPNTVVAISLVRSGEAAASVEEVFSSNSINSALGIVLPLLFWRGILGDRFLLLLDAPLTLALISVVLFYVLRGRISRSIGVILLATYVAWVLLRFWI
jgi:cation:H+ antiporter